jgi:hypothetical protein
MRLLALSGYIAVADSDGSRHALFNATLLSSKGRSGAPFRIGELGKPRAPPARAAVSASSTGAAGGQSASSAHPCGRECALASGAFGVRARLLTAAADKQSVATVHVGAESEGCGGCALLVAHESLLPFTAVDAQVDALLVLLTWSKPSFIIGGGRSGKCVWYCYYYHYCYQ